MIQTRIVETAFPDVVTLLGSVETDLHDFIGSYVPTYTEDGQERIVWQDGLLVQAMERGVPFLIDEIGTIAPNQLTALYSVMDGRDTLTITHNALRAPVKAAEGFFVIAATNPNAPGVRLSEALLSRFSVKVEVTTDFQAALHLNVPRKIISAAEHLAFLRETGQVTWAPEMRELLAFRDDYQHLGVLFALRNLINAAPEHERPSVTNFLQERYADTVDSADSTIKNLKI